jgi:hypothetical protein
MRCQISCHSRRTNHRTEKLPQPDAAHPARRDLHATLPELVGRIRRHWSSQVWAGETWFRGNSAKQVAVGRNADGRLEIFYVGTNNDLYHNHQTVPNGNGWAGETHFANNSAKQVAVGQNQDGRLEIFYVGTNNDLYHNWQTAPNSELWAGETHIADNSAQQIAVGRNTDGTLEIFYVGTNVGLYRNRQSAANSLTWNGETRFGDNSALQAMSTPMPTAGWRYRIASPELLPGSDPLPHLICSPPMFSGGGRNEADQHGNA